VKETGESVWVVTPSTEGDQTLDVSQTQEFLDYIEPWTKMEGHPNLLSVYGHGKEPLPWMAIETGDYPSVTETADKLSQDEKIDILTQVCEAVHHVHRYGIVYENLSPESIKITDEGQVKLRGPLDHFSHTSNSEVTEQTVVYRIGNIAKYLFTGNSSEGLPGEAEREIDKALSEQPSERHETVLHFRDALTQAYRQN
jgi:serine/threonine protein kinase